MNNLSLKILLAAVGEHGKICPDNIPDMEIHSIQLLDSDMQGLERGTLYICSLDTCMHFCRSNPDIRLEDYALLCACEESARPCGVISVASLSPTALFNIVLDNYIELSRWCSEMSRVIGEEKSFQALIDIADRNLDGLLMVWDMNFNILSHSKYKTSNSVLLNEMLSQHFFTKEIVSRIIVNRMLADPNVDKDIRVIDKEASFTNCSFYIKHFFSEERRSYSAAYITEQGEISGFEYEKMRLFFDAMDRLLKMSAKSSYDTIFEGLIRKILTESITDEGRIRENAATYELDYDCTYMFYLIEFSAFSKVKAELCAGSLRNVFSNAPILVYNDRVCFMKTKQYFKQCDNFVAQGRFCNLLESFDARCGISSVMHNLSECVNSYNQARTALELGKMQLEPNESRLYLYKQLAAYHMLSCYENSTGSIRNVLTSKLRYLYTDNPKDLENIELLEIFISCGMSSKATAEILDIHRNTVIYRINQLKEKYDIDFSNEDSMYELFLLFKIKQYKERFSPKP